MNPIKLTTHSKDDIDPAALDPELTEWDQRAYERITATELTPEQVERVVEAPTSYPRQKHVLGIHWHPEFIPLNLIMRRVDAMFPRRDSELIIPTQHNVLIELNGYVGVEVDCYSQPFNRKVQLLIHFAAPRLEKADVFKAMLAHTYKYRASQLFEFLDTLIEPDFDERMQRAAAKTGASEDLVRFVRVHALKLRKLIERNEPDTPPDMLKNKLLRFYFDQLRDHHDERVINHAQIFLNAVKKIVKANFSLTYFYRTVEIIEEVRSLQGGIVIPHPEQFWPVLLADYDVDGIEVWNPQSREYTEFLVNCVHRQNTTQRKGQPPLLIFMGDDTHFGEKVIEPARQDPSKASRELGVQPAWDDLSIRKSLIVAGASRKSMIEDYKTRLG